MNIAVHEMVAKHANRPDASHFLRSEIVEYRAQEEKLSLKYADVLFSEQEAIKKLKEIIEETM